MKDLRDFPKVSLGIFPTPIQRLDNISRILGTNVWVKRDDMTGIGLGGNKIRKLEFLLADAIAQGAELVFTTGMTGYLETLTDPSYAGQIILQTFPMIGNYGLIPQDFEGNCFAKG